MGKIFQYLNIYVSDRPRFKTLKHSLFQVYIARHFHVACHEALVT